jgi:hypothetical protein
MDQLMMATAAGAEKLNASTSEEAILLEDEEDEGASRSRFTFSRFMRGIASSIFSMTEGNSHLYAFSHNKTLLDLPVEDLRKN